MKILLISHTCQSATEGQPRAYHLGLHRNLQLRVVVPNRWKHYGTWRKAEMPPAGSPFEFSPLGVALPWVGPAQYYLSVYPGLSRVLREFKPDIIDVWQEPWAAATAHACWLRDRLLPGCKIIVETEQNIDKVLPPPFESFRKYVLKHADFCIGRSNEAVDVLRTKGFAGPLAVVPNGVNADIFRPMDRTECRASRGLNGFVVGYVGRLLESKGVTDLLDAVARLKAPATLLLIGSGPSENELHKRAASAGIADRIIVLPQQPHERLPALMNAMDCLVLPSRTTERWKEQFGRVLIEAQSCGTPVVGSDSGAIPDVIGDAGIIFAERNVDALATALENIRANTAYARQLGIAGRTRAQERFTWSSIADQMMDIYERVLAYSPQTAAEVPHGALPESRPPAKHAETAVNSLVS